MPTWTLTPFFKRAGRQRRRRVSALDGRAYVGFGEDDRTRWPARVQIGKPVRRRHHRHLGPDERLFFSGGGATVRGQEYRSLGAVQMGQPSGGRGFLGLSGEVRHDIGDTNFGIVGFADAGYVSEGAFGEGDADWHAGAGVGVRYTTPFGPIRVDLATPVRGDDVGEEVFLYIGIGQAF